MRFDITKLPIGEMMLLALAAAVMATFITAFALTVDGGEEGEAVLEVNSTAGASPTTPPEGGAALSIAMVPTIKFDKEELTVTAGSQVTLTAENIDPGVFHNWAVYTSRQAAEANEKPIAATELCKDCKETITFEAPPPGEYFFRCDVHPIQMIGTLIVQ